MLVHSYIYYQLNDNIIDDSTWSKWAMELQKMCEKPTTLVVGVSVIRNIMLAKVRSRVITI